MSTSKESTGPTSGARAIAASVGDVPGGASDTVGVEPGAAPRRNAGVPVVFFDTTLRDGEQSPGSSLNASEKLDVAHQLARLHVDVIEAGFPASSPGDFAAVQTIAREVRGPVICGLARCTESDIRVCWDAIKDAKRPRIHTFVSTSDIHLKHQMHLDYRQVIKLTKEMTELCVSLCPDDVEFSAMDATRSDVDFLAEVLATAVAAGATTINVPDTVGYALPDEYAALFEKLYAKVPGLEKVVVSAHCHNDLGVAVANTLAAVEIGVTQVEVAINGIGERAGNAALEEVAMALVTRKDILQRPCNIVTTEIARASRMVSSFTGQIIQANKAIVGKNAFAHESGIHQDGVLKERTTYEIMHARDVGLGDSDIVLGKHSGRHALRTHLAEIGIHLEGPELDDVFARFKEIADKKKEVTTADLEALVGEEIRQREDVYALDHVYTSTGTDIISSSQVGVEKQGEKLAGKAFTGGSVESIFLAIDDAVGVSGKLLDYQVRSITSGKDSLGEVRVVVEVDGKRYAGQAVSIDVLEASAKAYVRALNNVAVGREAGGARGDRVYL